MAYLVDLTTRCDSDDCHQEARVALHSFRGCRLGRYCYPCGATARKDQAEEEELEVGRLILS